MRRARAEIGLLAESRTHLSLSPLTELRSMGIPPLGDFLDAGIPVSLSIDTIAIPTSADMFLQMNVTLSVERARRGEGSLSTRRVLELATIEGARDLGLEAEIGSLTPGKRADLIAVDIAGLNTSPAADPLSVLVFCARPSDVRLVVADGRILKRDGAIVVHDAGAVAAAARATLDGVISRSGWDLRLGVAADLGEAA
jgi:cytosine/adenosine deaminase-related metal-dependent hydrolase